MADQAFSNAGLGSFGADTAIARQMSTPDSFQEKMAKAAGAGGASNPLAMLANKAFESLANAFPDASKQISGIQGAIMPTATVANTPVAPVAPVQPVAPISGVAPVTATTGNTQPTTGGYRSFFNTPSFGTNPQ